MSCKWGREFPARSASLAVDFGGSLVRIRPVAFGGIVPSAFRLPCAKALPRSSLRTRDRNAFVRMPPITTVRLPTDALIAWALPRSYASAIGCQNPLFRCLRFVRRRGEILGFRLSISGQNPSRGKFAAASEIKADLLLRPPGGIVHWSVLLLRNLQSLGNESEHNEHLPALNFSETLPPSPCLPVKSRRSCLLFQSCPQAVTCSLDRPSLFVNNIS